MAMAAGLVAAIAQIHLQGGERSALQGWKTRRVGWPRSLCAGTHG